MTEAKAVPPHEDVDDRAPSPARGRRPRIYPASRANARMRRARQIIAVLTAIPFVID
jgi:hypothetical protein